MTEPSPADAALAAMHATFHDPDDGGWPGHDTITDRCHDCRLAAENVLAAVSPVIRRQEAREQRDAVKEIVFGTSVARSLAYTETPDALVAITAERIWSNLEGHFAAAIARTHAHPEVSSGAPAASPSAGGGTSG